MLFGRLGSFWVTCFASAILVCALAKDHQAYVETHKDVLLTYRLPVVVSRCQSQSGLLQSYCALSLPRSSYVANNQQKLSCRLSQDINSNINGVSSSTEVVSQSHLMATCLHMAVLGHQYSKCCTPAMLPLIPQSTLTSTPACLALSHFALAPARPQYSPTPPSLPSLSLTNLHEPSVPAPHALPA